MLIAIKDLIKKGFSLCLALLPSLIKKGFSIWRTRLVPFLVIGAISLGLSQIIGYFTTGKWLGQLIAAVEGANPGIKVDVQNIRELIKNVPLDQLSSLLLHPMVWIGVVLGVLVGLWAQAALILASHPYSSENPGSQPRTLRQIIPGALKFMGRLFVVELVFGLAGGLLSLPVLVVSTFIASLALNILLGLVLVAAVVYLAVYFAFAPLLLVLENLGIKAALKRSRELVKNRWLLTASSLVAILVLVFPLALLISYIPFGAPVAQLLLAPFAISCAVALSESLKETQE